MSVKTIRAILLIFACSASLFAGNNSRTLLFVGSYTNEKPDKGIFVFSFNEETGALKPLGHAENIVNPSYLCISPNGKYLYACSDTRMPKPGSISAFAIDSRQGTLRFINKQSSGGENPVYVAMDKTNRWVVTGNYSSGTLSLLHAKEDGSLTPDIETIAFKDSSVIKARQEKSHIHSSLFDPDFRYILAPDLGGDKIRLFNFDGGRHPHFTYSATLTKSTSPGDGPRHFAFHPNKKFGYCINELSGTVTAYRYRSGNLSAIQTLRSYAKARDSYGAADIHISPDGRFLYASNRFVGENTLAIFSILPKTGLLTLVGHQYTEGDHPRNFTIDPSGRFLLVANMLTNNIVIFKRDLQTGLLTKVAEEKTIERPSCLQMKTYGE